MDVVVFAPDANGDRQQVGNPGPDYANASPRLYDRCAITSINPPPPAEVEVGSTVTIEVDCTLFQEPPVEQPPVEQPPVDQPPVDQPPVEQPPVDQPPVEQPPVDQPPVEQPPADQLPAAPADAARP